MFAYHNNGNNAPDWKTAAHKSYYERWLPVANAKTLDGMREAYSKVNEDCPLCGERDKHKLYCTDCPLKFCSTNHAASLWGKYNLACIEYDVVAAHNAALAMCDRLCEIAGIEGEHRKPNVPDWWQEGWWVTNDPGINGRVGELATVPSIWRPATLDDLSFTRNGVKMWAWESENGNSRVSTYCNTHIQVGRISSFCDEDKVLLKALIGDVPIIPWEQWKELTEKEGK